ncbi:hypothetical protein [Rhizobium leguminosarum]|uniref:hypothetical protein n=1 Tax=Rhizobium leguminosarum TaxID=384 RepID=UPI0028C3970C|nr:hypothetical protein [Rhizobium leguminosarum]
MVSKVWSSIKELPGEVYFFVLIWLGLVPALALYFVATLVYASLNNIDISQVSDFAFLWPVMVISFLTIFFVVQLGAYHKFRTGFFLAWLEVVMGTPVEELYERGRQARLEQHFQKNNKKG